MFDFQGNIEALNSEKGTYMLFIYLKNNINVIVSRKKFMLKKGYYIYVGSAFGNGGIKARVKRHLRKQKRIHWHIDHITGTEESEIIAIALATEQQVECIISSILSSINDVTPIFGFGNTDCKDHCESHLFFIN